MGKERMPMFKILTAVASIALCSTVNAGPPSGTISFGDHSVADGIVTVKILYECNDWLAGFQFDIVGAEILDAYGGLCESYDWLLDHSAFRVLGVGLGSLHIAPTTSAETLLELRLQPTASTISFDGAIFADPNAEVIPMDATSVLDLDPACEGDLNNDGAVTGADIGLFLVAWGTDDAAADFDGDGVVDGADLGIILAAWGDC